jgi:hypothetical protein
LPKHRWTEIGLDDVRFIYAIPLDCLSVVTIQKKELILLATLYRVRLMSVERKNPLKRDQALNDATSGQIGEEPRPEQSSPSSSEPSSDINEQRLKAARKMSRDL